MEDIIDEIKAKHTAPDDVKLKRLEKKFEPVEKILREGRLPKYNELPGSTTVSFIGGVVLNSSGLSSKVLTIF
jgi:vacuolar-type H+-ATPase subunit E/Vma4